MRKEEIFQQIRGKLIVSCQANEEENPFNPPEEMTRMAKAAAIGGCAGFRANRPENVRMIKEAFPDKVMIGIWKVVTEGCDVYITPTMKEVEVLREIGSDIIAVDGTDRINCNGRKAYELIREIKETSQRLAVARQLDAGKSYSAIEEATGASATTIARVSKCLSYGAGGYNAALNVLDDAEKKRR